MYLFRILFTKIGSYYNKELRKDKAMFGGEATDDKENEEEDDGDFDNEGNEEDTGNKDNEIEKEEDDGYPSSEDEKEEDEEGMISNESGGKRDEL